MELCAQESRECVDIYCLKGLLYSCCELLLRYELKYFVNVEDSIRLIMSKRAEIVNFKKGKA